MNRIVSEATDEGQNIFLSFLEKAPMILLGIIILIVFFMLAKIFRRTVTRKLAERNTDDQTALLVSRIVHIGTIIIGFTIALKMVGIDIVALVGLFGLGIGFAVQDIIKNFVSGALILIQQPFRIGDLIKVNDYIGIVESIESRATNIRTFDGQRVIIPNADAFSNSVINYSSHPERRVTLVVGVEYSTNLSLAAQTIMQVMDENPNILKHPEPMVFFEEFGDSSINLSAKFWVDTRINIFEMKSIILQEVKKAFDKVGINIPFPIRTLKIDREQEINVLMQEKNKETKSQS